MIHEEDEREQESKGNEVDESGVSELSRDGGTRDERERKT
jgi:hypothetical protein